MTGTRATRAEDSQCDCRPGEACSECYEGPLRVKKASKERVVLHSPGCGAFVDGGCDKDCAAEDAAMRARVERASAALASGDDLVLLDFLRGEAPRPQGASSSSGVSGGDTDG